MRRASALFLLLVAAAPAAHANEASQALGARALIALHGGKTQEGLALLDSAIAADPSDVDALAQRGATRAQQGDYPGAIVDLRAALAINPNLPPVALELGVALTETGDYREAEPWLMRAQQQPDLEAQASFFLGLTQLRLDRLDDAQRNFERARAGDASLALSTEYY
ncbi:MAG: tetratricopeptide repeat protein, partial [Candidatus Binatia bacterium]